MRRLLNLVTVLSALASVAVLVAWVRSHFARDLLACAPLTVTPEGHRSGVYMLHTREGVFTVDAVRRHRTIAAMPAREYADHLDLAEAEHRVAGEWTWMTRPPAAFPSTKGRPFSRVGFAGQVVKDRTPGYRFLRIEWSMPFWFTLLLVSLPLDVRIIRNLRRSRLRRAGACPACGYDLRATPESCPECGHIAAPTTSRSACCSTS